ncbi:MAG: GMC family oxidoreductase [Gammaproteobacteria bacterium]
MSSYDAIIIGAGLSGALTAEALASAGFKVLVLEAGADYIDRNKYLERFYAADIKTPESAYPSYPQALFPRTEAVNDYFIQTGPQQFKSTYIRMLGGTTLHWLGTCLRLHPNDFQLKTLYDVGKDWPISYAELEPWYGKAEQALGVAGNSQIKTYAPRSQSYPMPEIPMTYLAKMVQKKLATTSFENMPIQVLPTPQARNSVNGYQNRPVCCGSHSCIPICPVQAKYEALVHINLAKQKGAVFQTESVVDRLEVEQSGSISAVHYLRWDGSKHSISAKVYILAAHGIETPKILLNSRNSRFPNGIANSSDQVGRNLMDHPSQLSFAIANDPVYPKRSPLSTAGIESLMDGPFRKKYAGFRTQIDDNGNYWTQHTPFSTVEKFVQQNLFGEDLNKAIQDSVTHEISIESLLEQLPNPTNRVTLAEKRDSLGIPRPQIYFDLDEYLYAGLARARKFHQLALEKIGVTHINHYPDQEWQPSGHIMGTTVMGNDPKTSVVDKNLCSHDHPNLFILGSSVFPTSGCVNPSLTIAAMTLQANQAIMQKIKGLSVA